jgi:tetratricopeptide (TPR) repeat protein
LQRKRLRDSGRVALASGELDRAAELLDEADELGRTFDYPDRGVVAVNRALVEIMRHDWPRAEELAVRAIATADDAGDAGIRVDCLVVLALALLGQERFEDARPLLLDAFEGALVRRKLALGDVVDCLAAVAASRGEHRHAARLIGCADHVRREIGIPSEGEEADWVREQTVQLVGRELGAELYERLLSEGAALPVECARELVPPLG